jgi:hypothetical protein
VKQNVLFSSSHSLRHFFKIQQVLNDTRKKS